MSTNDLSVMALLPAHNEEKNIEQLIQRFPPDSVQKIVIVNDGSTDLTAAKAKNAGAHVLDHSRRLGCGPSVRTGLDYALRAGFDVAVVVAGNGKDDPAQVEMLLEPLRSGRADMVQGSRYLAGGVSKNMPLHRKIGTRAYSFLFSCLCGKRITDGTNGFRALRTQILRDDRIRLEQDWLSNYEVESYLFFQAIRFGYRVQEVGVSKIYPPGKREYTQMRPFRDWWSHFRPALLLRLGIKR